MKLGLNLKTGLLIVFCILIVLCGAVMAGHFDAEGKDSKSQQENIAKRVWAVIGMFVLVLVVIAMILSNDTEYNELGYPI